MAEKNIQNLSINTIRLLAAEGVQKANSGHPGMPMGCAPIAYLLYKEVMNHNPNNSKWYNRDRFVLSAGHGSMLLYSILHLSGYKVTIDNLKNFRQYKSITPGHPEFGLTDGVETTTGPLGQGFSNACGMALANKFMSAKFNKPDFKLIDNWTYAIASDGDLMEGVSQEAASIAGHNQLGKLIVFYDDNSITIDGSTDLSFSDDVKKRFESYGWNVFVVDDVNDLDKLRDTVKKAKSDEAKPNLIITKTHIGFGSPNKQDTSGVHGAPLGEEELEATKRNLGWEYEESFFVPDEVREHFKEVAEEGAKKEEAWNKLFETYKQKFPQEGELLENLIQGNFGSDWEKQVPSFDNYGDAIATRKISEKVINSIAGSLPTMLGGSADLAASNNTIIKDGGNFTAGNPTGRNIFYGIREHAMGAIMNGMSLYGGIIPFGGTFLIFSDYMRGSIRLAALSQIKVIYIFTHDSVGLGEDGPTHQPVEHLAALRAIPNLVVLRPSDANETAEAWRTAVKEKDNPVAILLTRQSIPVIDRSKYNSADNLAKGAYVIRDAEGEPEVILLSSGSEVSVTIDAAEKLESEGVKTRVVSMPSWELFERQSDQYKNEVLPKSVKKRISVEAGINQGWEKYIGDEGISISIETFGLSAPYKKVFEHFGITVENIVEKAKNL